ncbi:MAG: glycosyltransferase family 39 protein [Clostridia bacterium]
MTFAIIISIIFLLAMFYFIKYFPENINFSNIIFPIGASLALLIRVIFAFSDLGFYTDLNLFQAWGQLVNDVGFVNVYTQTDIYLDYPPGYLYVLTLLDNIRNLFSISTSTSIYYAMLKAPTILSDMACGVIIYKFAQKRFTKSYSSFIAFAYLFCPMVILDGAIWGQIDSVTSLILLISLLYLKEDKFIFSGTFYGLGLITKPQLIIFAPIFIFYTLFRKKYKGLGLGVIFALFVVIVVSFPFSRTLNISWLVELYTSTMNYYNYYTINAYNFWGMIGFNWNFLPSDGILATALGIVPSLIATIVCGVYVYLFKHKKECVFTAAALTMATVFMFATKMHERYLFPVFILLLLSYIISQDKRYLISFTVLSVLSFLNTAYILYLNNTFISSTAIEVITISTLNVIFYFYFVYHSFFGDKGLEKWTKKEKPQLQLIKNFKVETLKEVKNENRKLFKIDFMLMISITVFYAIFAFWNLGATTTANTSWLPFEGDSAVFEVDSDASGFIYLAGISSNESFQRVGCNIDVEVSTDGVNYTYVGNLSDSYVYEWKTFYLGLQANFVRLTALDSSAVLNEVRFINSDSTEFVDFTLLSDDAYVLVDEQDSVPINPGYFYSTYFDEIYHARTAFEYILEVEPYENTHPTLGKLIISLGIIIFGMNPFGWRFMGALFGVLMLPILYHILKRLFGNSYISAVGTFLFAFDFMHFTQTRIATIDTYAVFFILLMYQSMLIFIQKDFATSSFKSLITPLLISGLFMGLGISAKWTCAYGAIGLAVLFAIKLIYEYNKANKKDKELLFLLYVKLCPYCIGFFIIIPILIYFVAFLPLTLLEHNSSNIIQTFINYQTHMYNYHSSLVAEHYFASPWYEWPLAIRNIWYFVSYNYEGTGLISTISCLGNPILWWSCLLSMLFALYMIVKTRSQKLVFICVGFLSVYMPWVLVPRLTFVYHYFTAVPFIIMALMFTFIYFKEKPYFSKKVLYKISLGDIIIALFVVLNFVLFVIYYPVISGAPTTQEYIDALEILPNWYLG